MKAAPLAALLVLAAPFLHPQAACAQAPGEDDLLAVLAEETAVATANRMNADYVPGIVSVLHGDEMEALGARTVLEALSHVPGILALPDANGHPALQVRGIDLLFGNGGVRVLVDSRSLTRESTGISSAVLLMPVEQVDRIEVLRGPGSVWGDFAFVGLVNIVTRAAQGRAWTAAGSGGLATGGAAITMAADAAGGATPLGAAVTMAADAAGGATPLGAAVTMAADAAGGATSGAGAPGKHKLHGSASISGWRSLSGGYADGARGTDRRLFGNGALAWGPWTLSGAGVWRDIADYRPVGFIPGLFRSVFERSQTAELRYTHAPRPDRRLSAFVSTVDTAFQIQVDRYESTLLGGGLEAVYGLGPHRLLVKADASAGVIEEASHLPPPVTGRPSQVVTIRDVHQDSLSLTLQDELALGRRLTVTAGARWDDQSDIGSQLSPRLAAVWRVSDGGTLKAQWATGFRSLPFFQLYPGGRRREADFETSQTAELSWIVRRPSLTARLTLFHAEVDDLAFVAPPPVGVTTRDARATGLEAEWSQSLGERLKVLANLSWVDTEDERGAPAGETADSFGEAAWLWNLALLLRPAAGLTAGLRWNHCGRRSPAPGGATGLPGFERVDATLSFRPPREPRISFRGGVLNLLDDEVTAGNRLPDRTLVYTFSGRTVTFQAALSF